jgi:hypothetical protein
MKPSPHFPEIGKKSKGNSSFPKVLLRPPPDYARDFLFWAWLKIKLRLACRFGRQGPQFQHRGLHLVWSGSFLAFSLLRLRYFGVAVCAVRLVLGFWAGMDEQSLGPISSCWKLLGSIVCWYSYIDILGMGIYLIEIFCLC